MVGFTRGERLEKPTLCTLIIARVERAVERESSSHMAEKEPFSYAGWRMGRHLKRRADTFDGTEARKVAKPQGRRNFAPSRLILWWVLPYPEAYAMKDVS